MGHGRAGPVGAGAGGARGRLGPGGFLTVPWFGYAGSLRAGIGFDDGSVIRFEFPRLAVPDGRNLVNRLRRVLTERSTGESTGEPTAG
ncbi:hypothetical protein GCM10009654_30480 [Streptomyces hebeiensis]|uniref:Uncharacterized protein n=1 Tax=Streptomyces hebeiensis TaxID=229486 RepID=A0ABN1UUQ0_9ACTN